MEHPYPHQQSASLMQSSAPAGDQAAAAYLHHQQQHQHHQHQQFQQQMSDGSEVGAGCGGCGRCAGCGTWLASSGAGQLLADLTGHLCRLRPLRPLPSALSFLSVRADAANAATASLRRHPSFSLPASSSFSLPRASHPLLNEGLEEDGQERPSKVLKHHHHHQQQQQHGYGGGEGTVESLSASGSAPEVQANRVIFVEPMEGESVVLGGGGMGEGGDSAARGEGSIHFEGFETVNFDTTSTFAEPLPRYSQSSSSSSFSSSSSSSLPSSMAFATASFKRRPSIALPSPIPLTSEEQAGRRRRAIFGESVEPEGLEASIASLPRPPPKSAETQQALEQALKTNVMFSHLERDDRAELFDAMFEVRFNPGDAIINQGDEGDNFYVVETGTCEVWKSIDGNEPELVLTIVEGGSFGELALIYGTQRAASVKARTAVVLWAIHRSTYRRVLMGATLRKRTLYESFLKNVPILAPLERYERLMVADALEAENFEDGAAIITQDEVGDAFYIIVEGQVRVTQGEEEVARLGASAYFGEIALLTNQPRRATVTAVGATKCAKISRKKFFRVMGPCQDVLRHNMLQLYPQYAGQL